MKSCSRKTCTQLNPQPLDSFGACARLPSGKRPECKTCRKIEDAAAYKRNPQQVQERNKRWAETNPQAAAKARIEAELNQHPYRRAKKETCEDCGFIPVDLCQLHVDHMDGDHSHNYPSNLRTLCANCHALKTKRCKDTVRARERNRAKRQQKAVGQ